MPRSRCPNGTRKNPKTGRCEPARSTSKKRVISEYSGQKFKIKRSKRGNQRALANQMRNELVEKSKVYQEFKANQVVKKSLAKRINANNLRNKKKSLKKVKV